MQISPYLMFNGQCEAAFRFYERALGAQIVMMSRYETSPMAEKMPPEQHQQIIHARLKIGGTMVMGSDALNRYMPPQGFSMSVEVGTPEEAEKIFQALSEGGSVSMPMQETFWARRFGMLTDQFGIAWMVDCEKPQPA